MKWLAIKSALHAHFAFDDTCPWCRIGRKDMSTKKRQICRTSQNSRTAAHLPPLDQDGCEVFPFTCDVCQLSFTKEQWCAEDLSSEALSKLFTQTHCGHVWRRQSLSCDPRRFVMCLLHMRLSFCSSLWTWLVKPSAQVKQPAVAEQVLGMLHKDGVNIWRLQKLTSTAEEACKNASFTGGAADKVMSRFEEYMEVLECKSRDKG